jgi:hypothetical protein
MRDKAAVFIVLAAVQPEWQQFRGQVFSALFKTGGHLLCVKSHLTILSIGI